MLSAYTLCYKKTKIRRPAQQFNIIPHKVHSPTNALFIKLEKVLKFTVKFTLIMLLHVSVYDHHQGAFIGA